MHYVQRRNRRYLYRSYRDANGNVCRRYIGTGTVADLCLLEYQAKKAEKAARREQLQHLLNDIGQPQQEAREFSEWTELLTRSSLLQAGYYLHYRSQWRARSGKAQTKKKYET